jgi:hypothetical protein
MYVDALADGYSRLKIRGVVGRRDVLAPLLAAGASEESAKQDALRLTKCHSIAWFVWLKCVHHGYVVKEWFRTERIHASNRFICGHPARFHHISCSFSFHYSQSRDSGIPAGNGRTTTDKLPSTLFYGKKIATISNRLESWSHHFVWSINTVGIEAISSRIELVWDQQPCPLNRVLEVSDDVSSDTLRYYIHNKGIFSHVILLPYQTGCYEDCNIYLLKLHFSFGTRMAGRGFIHQRPGKSRNQNKVGHFQINI